MARQIKRLPARGQGAVDESLLIRSAESLGRVIGTLQRQLDAARRLVGPAAVDGRHNGHMPARQRDVVSAKAPAKTKRTAGAVRSVAKKTTTKARKRSATTGRTTKNR